jgi:hypothetical protein
MAMTNLQASGRMKAGRKFSHIVLRLQQRA